LGVGSPGITEARIAVAVISIGTLGYCVYLLAHIRRTKQKGARSVIVDTEGVEVVYSNRSKERVRWADPALKFEIQDLSSLDPRMLVVPSPYLLVVDRVSSALSSQAFSAVVFEARGHGIFVAQESMRGFYAPRMGRVLRFESNIQSIR
jgi:hypothetical protein